MIPRHRLTLLPREYHFAHEFAFYLHDVLAEVVVHGDLSGLIQHTINFRSPKEAKEFGRTSPDDIVTWLADNGRKEDAREVVIRHSFFALLSDMCHYICEALFNSEKAKLTVAYTLFRKPLKDNLFFLEWMLASPDEYADSFINDDASGRDKIPESKRRDILRQAVASAQSDEYVDEDYLYSLRYDQKCPWALTGLWDKSIHLVTGNKHHSTEKQNFNFVFSGDDARESQWESIYLTIPFLLLHAVDVVEAILGRFTELRNPESTINSLRRQAGALFYSHSLKLGSSEERKQILEDATRGFGFSCVTCGNSVLDREVEWLRFFRYCKLKCQKCNNITKLPERPAFGYCAIDEDELAAMGMDPKE